MTVLFPLNRKDPPIPIAIGTGADKSFASSMGDNLKVNYNGSMKDSTAE
jgi:hypothetical protein